MERRVVFPERALPYLLLAPQLAIILVFFYWPAGQALWMSTLLQDPLGLSVRFVGLENFRTVLGDPEYYATVGRTLLFSAAVVGLAMLPALALAVMADKVVRGLSVYRTLLIIPYAIAPAVAGTLFLFLFNPSVGVLGYALGRGGLDWNPRIDGVDAMVLIILASAWKMIAYNFIFFLAGLQAIPKSLTDAAAIDGAGPSAIFWRIVFPLLAPTTFFLLIVNLTYAFFDTFGIVHAMTQGGPGKATEILIYKAWYDGIQANDLGRSAAQSVLLMGLVIGLTLLQFRAIDRRVHY